MLKNRQHEFAKKHPLAATAAETVALYTAKKVIRKAGEARGLNFGNGHTQRKLERAVRHPFLTAASAVVVAPIVEELFFRRYLPDRAKQKLKASQYKVASRRLDHASTMAFALPHIGNPLSKKGRSNLAIPLNPMIGGEHYSFLARKRGLKYAMAAHAINNALFCAEVAPKVLAMRRNQYH